LSASVAEGAAAEVAAACCGSAALTGWALYLGLSATLIAIVATLPIVAQTLQVAGALAAARFGHQRTALTGMVISRLALLPLILLPVLPLSAEGRRTLLLVVAGIHHGLGIVGASAWSDWMGETVPRRLRGRYFGRRTAVSTLSGGVMALLGGLALDRGLQTASTGLVLQTLAIIGCLAGALSITIVARQQVWPSRLRTASSPLARLLRPLGDDRARPVVGYTVAWYAACGLSAPFFGLYLLRDLRTGFTLLAAQGAGLTLARVASASAWGRAVDRVGAKRVLVACTCGLAFAPVAWIASGPGQLWPLAFETLIGGALFGGHTIASTTPAALCFTSKRTFILSCRNRCRRRPRVCNHRRGRDGNGRSVRRPFAVRARWLCGSAALRLAAIAMACLLPSPPAVDLMTPGRAEAQDLPTMRRAA